MNKPAAKEPSMDEILSSIRQIIADDDASAQTEGVSLDDAGAADDSSETDAPADEGLPSFDAFLADDAPEAVVPDEPEPEPAPEPEIAASEEDEADALALSLDQVIEAEQGGEAEADLPELPGDDAGTDEAFSLPDDVAFIASETDEPEPDFSASTMPDPKLSADIADTLLDKTAQAAAADAFSKLGVLSLGAGSQTIEGIVKELLRPMLKSWLDENLPAVVERLVEREIERVSRGGR